MKTLWAFDPLKAPFRQQVLLYTESPSSAREMFPMSYIQGGKSRFTARLTELLYGISPIDRGVSRERYCYCLLCFRFALLSTIVERLSA